MHVYIYIYIYRERERDNRERERDRYRYRRSYRYRYRYRYIVGASDPEKSEPSTPSRVARACGSGGLTARDVFALGAKRT